MIHIVLVILIYLVKFSDGKIQIFLKAASNKDDITVTCSGVDKKLIAQMEVKLLNITDNNLRKGVRIELGKEPDDIFLNDPTKYGNLYEKYNWMPVTRELEVDNVKILEVINENVVLKNHDYVNNTTETIKTKASIYETVESTVTSFWNKKGLPEDEILYNIGYNFHGEALSFQNRWRKNNFHSASLPFGITKDGYVHIKPGKRTTMRLKGKKVVILIEIHYVARLIGCIVVNYAHLYGKYHFWAPAVNDIMKAKGIDNKIMTTELIEVRSYADPILEIFDSSTGYPIRIVTPFTPFRVRFKPKNKRV